MSIQHITISLWSAIIININIIIGTGIFINTTELANRTGVLGGICYALVGLLLLPLILSFVRLIELYPQGGFYAYCSTSLSPFAGFLSTWCYFFSKLSSATLSIHIFTILMQKIFPTLALYNSLYIDFFILSIVLALNMLNVRTGSAIQKWIMVLKLFPVFFVIGIGIFFTQNSNLTPINQLWDGIPSAIPLVLHALLGFEIACAISRNIEKPHINGPRAILISYAIVIILFVLYQTLFYTAVGFSLGEQSNYSNAFPLLITLLNVPHYLQTMLGTFIHIAIAFSALSASFGIVYANLWNLYSLAELGHIPYAPFIMQHNRFNIPFLCVVAQGIIMIIYLIVICGKQVTFQQLSAFGAIITYALSISGLFATYIQKNKSLIIPLLGLFNCALLLSVALYAMWKSDNFIPVQLFLAIVFLGAFTYSMSNGKEKP